MRTSSPLVLVSFATLAGCAVAVPLDGTGSYGDAGVADTAPRADVGPPATRADTGVATSDSGSPEPTDAPSSSECSFSGTVATFTFDGQPGDQSSVEAASNATGFTVSALGRSSALAPNTGNGSINASGWMSSAAYYTFTVTPPAGCAFAPSALSGTLQASGTGPSSVRVATSIDAFTPSSSTAVGTFTSTLAGTSARDAKVEIRILGTGATSGSGTMRITSLTLSGALE